MSIVTDLIALLKTTFASASSGLQSLYAHVLSRIASIRKHFKDNPLDGSTFRRARSAEAIAPRRTTVPENTCVYAIGDIHGRMDLLAKLIEKIEADVRSLPSDIEVSLVFLGDYIDRGLQSKQVIEYFLSGALDAYNPVYLMGNHEEALLRFVHDANFGQIWASYGGVETLYSYGFQVPAQSPTGDPMNGSGVEDAWHKLWGRFCSDMPEDHLRFYRRLKPYHSVGDYVFVHAGMRPGIPIENQSVSDLFWIRDEFLNDRREFDKIIVHGHTPADKVFRDNRRIGLDTGAYITGCLSAGRFWSDEVKFIST